MNLQAQNFLSLLRAFIHSVPPRLTAPDWEELYHMAKKNNLAPAICDTALSLPEFSSASPDVRRKFTDTLLAQSGAQLLRTEEFFSVYGQFLACGIRPLALKGIVCRTLYPKPELRLSCDEDIWIPAEALTESDRILRGAGFTPAVPCEAADVSSVQALTYTGAALTIELHINPFGTTDEIRRKMNLLFSDPFSHAVAMEIEGHTVYTLDYTDHYLFLFAHLYKHFIGAGVGIRQIMDLLLFGQKYHRRIDFSRIHRAVASLGGSSFYRAVLKIGSEYLGFRGVVSSFPPEKLVPLMDDLMESGCFGNSTRAQQLSSIYISLRRPGGSKKRRRLLPLIFPPRSAIAPRYTFLYDSPWLLPAAWAMRITRITGELFFQNRSLLSEMLSRGRRRVKLFRKYRF